MTEIPHYFEYLKERGEKSKLHPFSYNKEEKTFTIADKQVELVEFDPYMFNPLTLGIDYDGIEVDDIIKCPALLPSFGPVIVGPKLHNWAEKNPEKIGNVYKVMHAAFVSFFEDPTQISGERSSSHMGFASGLREYGGIGLQVVGNCACMGPDPDGMYVRDQFEFGFAEYDLHNADSQSQRASLYAGIGHLARLATAESE